MRTFCYIAVYTAALAAIDRIAGYYHPLLLWQTVVVTAIAVAMSVFSVWQVFSD